MDLKKGALIGRYEIVGVAGRGGMGEVFRARDPRLGRDVAIKRLAPHISERESLRERFMREARAISRLHHPHICGLYDVIEKDGDDYLVLEFLDGVNLSDALKTGPLGVPEVGHLALQLASALEAVHGHGLFHRDIKPGNVMLCASGAKLFDFGVAKATTSFIDSGEDAETLAELTSASSLVGTLRFMAPEQVRADQVDERSDLFSLGSVLYSALTGRSAVQATTVSGVVGELSSFQPPEDFTRPDGEPVPEALVQIITRLLATRPEDRFQSAAGLTEALTDYGITPQTPIPVAASSGVERASPRGARVRIGSAAAVALLGVAGVWLALQWSRSGGGTEAESPGERGVRRYSVNLSYPLPPPNEHTPDLALSRDGRFLVYLTEMRGQRMVVLRSLDQISGTLLEHSAGASAPFFSHDGEWLGFHLSPLSQIVKVAVAGGEPIPLGPMVLPTSGYFTGEGRVVYWGGIGQGLVAVPEDGGEPEVLTELADGEILHSRPTMVPEAGAVLFHVMRDGDRASRIEALVLATGERKVVLEEASRALYLPPDHLFYSLTGKLMSARFDPERLEIIGAAQPITEPGLVLPDIHPSHYGVAADGTFVFLSDALEQRALVWVSKDGSAEPAAIPAGKYLHVRLSPSGGAVVVDYADLGAIDHYSLETGVTTRLAGPDHLNFLPMFSPDGRQIVFSSSRSGEVNLYLQTVGGVDEPRQLTQGPGFHAPHSWTPDGKQILFSIRSTQETSDQWIVDIESGEMRSLLANPFDEGAGHLSPDGTLLAYLSYRSGEIELYLETFPQQDRRWQVSSGPSEDPVWSPDGTNLFYRQGDRLMAVPIASGESEPIAGPARELFEQAYLHDVTKNRPWDVSPDGERFLMLTVLGSEQARRQLIVVEGWLSTLRDRAE